MCDFSGKLIAWLDHELADDEAARVEQHLENCPECRERVAVYAKVSEGFAEYWEAIVAGSSKSRRGWLTLAASAAAVAAGVVLVLIIPRTSVNPVPPPPPSAAMPVRSIDSHTTLVATRTVHRRRTPAPVQKQTARWQPAQTDIQIAIPAEAIFPPGALPDGFQFTADLSIAADGSPQGLRIIP